MAQHDSEADARLHEEEDRVSRLGMTMLTGGLTHEGDSFLIAVVAAMVAGGLYPLIGAWAFLAFPLALAGAIFLLIRKRRARREHRAPNRHRAPVR
jgi:hypothetical protein